MSSYFSFLCNLNITVTHKYQIGSTTDALQGNGGMRALKYDKYDTHKNTVSR